MALYAHPYGPVDAHGLWCATCNWHRMQEWLRQRAAERDDNGGES